MNFFTQFLTLLTFLIAPFFYAQAANESDQIVVRLSTDVQLIPIQLKKIEDSNSGLSNSYLQKIEGVLQFDLNHNGMTYTIPKKDGAYYIISLYINAEKKLSAEMSSVNGDTSKEVNGLPLTGNISTDRRQIHLLADAIHKALFDKDGIASTRILYTVKKQIGDNKWTSDIWEADYDGENSRPIINDKCFNISPVYVPPQKGQKCGSFFYVSYKAAQPKIYISSLQGGTPKRFITLRGNQLMPAISRQRDKVAFICDVTSNPDLFLQPFNAEAGAMGKPQQIFSARQASQGTPAFSPDGKKIAFVSNKDGSPRIYVIDIPSPGTSLKDVTAKLVTKHCKESSAPAWSPDGSKLAYCAMTGGVRQIWIYDFNTKEERQLTQGAGNKENPSWAPNSLNLVYNSSAQGNCELFLINLNQPKATKITSGTGEKRFPNWEPV